MRTLAFRGLASAVALLSAGIAAGADSAPARSTMTAGTAAAPSSSGNWGSVPDVGLNPPVATPAPAPAPQSRPGGWGPGGWQSGNAPPSAVAPTVPPPMATGGAAPRSEMRTGTDPRADGWRGDRGPRDGGWRGRDGYGLNYGPGGMAWSGRYNRIGRGYVVPGYLRAPTFFVNDWWSWGLGRPGYGQTWIRYYDDALLIDPYGRVVDTRYGVDWDRPGPPDYPDYGDGDGYEPGNYDRGFRDDGVNIYRSGPGAPGVTVHRGPDGSTVVVVQNPPGTTTTTTTYYNDVITSGPKVRKPRKPRKR